MSNKTFPLKTISGLAKIGFDPHDQKLQNDFSDIIQLIDKITYFNHDTINENTANEPESSRQRQDIVSSLNRRGRTMILAPKSVDSTYYAVPIVIEDKG